MSGVIAVMRRTLLSCSSLARNGLTVAATSMVGALFISVRPVEASDLPLMHHGITSFIDLSHQ